MKLILIALTITQAAVASWIVPDAKETLLFEEEFDMSINLKLQNVIHCRDKVDGDYGKMAGWLDISLNDYRFVHDDLGYVRDDMRFYMTLDDSQSCAQLKKQIPLEFLEKKAKRKVTHWTVTYEIRSEDLSSALEKQDLSGFSEEISLEIAPGIVVKSHREWFNYSRPADEESAVDPYATLEEQVVLSTRDISVGNLSCKKVEAFGGGDNTEAYTLNIKLGEDFAKIVKSGRHNEITVERVFEDKETCLTALSEISQVLRGGRKSILGKRKIRNEQISPSAVIAEKSCQNQRIETLQFKLGDYVFFGTNSFAVNTYPFACQATQQ